MENNYYLDKEGLIELLTYLANTIKLKGYLTQSETDDLYQPIGNYAEWVESESDPGKYVLIANNSDLFVGRINPEAEIQPSDESFAVAIGQVNELNIVDLGSPQVPLNLNIPTGIRVTVKEKGLTGEEAHQIAYLSDVDEVNTLLEDIKDDLKDVYKNVSISSFDEDKVTLTFTTVGEDTKDIILEIASEEFAGLMSAKDKTKLDRITTANFDITGVTPNESDVVINTERTTIETGIVENLSKTIPAASASSAGVMTKEDKIKLDNTSSDLETEIKARKAVDGLDGQSYVANSETNYISEAKNLNNADILLDEAIKNVSDTVTANKITAADKSVVVTPSTDGTTIKVNIKSEEKNLKLDSTNGLYTDIKINKLIAPESGENVFEEYELLSSDNTRLGTTIKVYKDRSLEEVKFVDTNGDGVKGNFLRLIYNLANGELSTVYMDMSEVLIESEFGAGLEVDDHIVKVKRDDDSESFLTVSEDGVKVSGILTAIDTAKNAVQDNLNAEIERATNKENEIKGELDSYKTSNDKALADEISRAKGAEKELQDNIDNISNLLLSGEEGTVLTSTEEGPKWTNDLENKLLSEIDTKANIEDLSNILGEEITDHVFDEFYIPTIIPSSGESLDVEVGKYYRFDEEVNTLTVNLPIIEDTARIKVLQLVFTTGDTPQVTITSESDIAYFNGYSIEPNTTYEINLMFNGLKWIVAYGIVE